MAALLCPTMPMPFNGFPSSPSISMGMYSHCHDQKMDHEHVIPSGIDKLCLYLNSLQFDINTWIINNGLIDIQDLLIKHGLTTLDSLSFHSQQFKSLQSDPIWLRNIDLHSRASLFKAIKLLQHRSKNHSIANVLSNLESKSAKLGTLSSWFNDLNDRQNQHNKHNQHNFRIIKQNIHTFFKEIAIEIRDKRRDLLQTVQDIEDKTVKHQENINKNILSQSESIINAERQRMNITSNNIHNLIKSVTHSTIDSITNQVLGINDNMDIRFDSMYKALNFNSNLIEDSMTKSGTKCSSSDIRIKFDMDDMQTYKERLCSMIKMVDIEYKYNQNNQPKQSGLLQNHSCPESGANEHKMDDENYFASELRDIKYKLKQLMHHYSVDMRNKDGIIYDLKQEIISIRRQSYLDNVDNIFNNNVIMDDEKMCPSTIMARNRRMTSGSGRIAPPKWSYNIRCTNPGPGKRKNKKWFVSMMFDGQRYESTAKTKNKGRSKCRDKYSKDNVVTPAKRKALYS